MCQINNQRKSLRWQFDVEAVQNDLQDQLCGPQSAGAWQFYSCNHYYILSIECRTNLQCWLPGYSTKFTGHLYEWFAITLSPYYLITENPNLLLQILGKWSDIIDNLHPVAEWNMVSTNSTHASSSSTSLSFSSTLQIILKAANHITEINEQLHNIARDEGQFANLHI